MISAEMSTSPWVLDTSGDRLSVQLTNTADRSEKSHSVWEHSSSCMALSRTGTTATVSRWMDLT